MPGILYSFSRYEKKEIPLNKTSVAIVRNSCITLGNPTGHTEIELSQLSYACFTQITSSEIKRSFRFD